MPPSEHSDLWDRLQSLLGDGYRVERELPSGGMSRLFLATDRTLDRSVVVKVLPPELAGEVNAARFEREIAVTAHFQHPHILPILSAGADESLLYYIMPFVDGESLQQRMTREGRLPGAEAYRLLAEIADALAYAHAHGVIHRDVKPANIMIAGEHAVLVDFGVAQAVVEAAIDTRITGTGHYVGTTQYMAPEQFAASSEVDGRADVYSLGVVIFEVLTGKLPHADHSTSQASQSWTNRAPWTVSGLRSEVPRELSELVERALASTLEERLPTAAALRDGLTAALARPRRRFYRRPLGAVALVLGATAAGVLLWRQRPRPAVDDDRVAIAPFDVMQGDYALWREGFVDVLSANLDGAGPLRTVPPSVVLRSWRGRVDLESALAFGERTGARFVVLGQVLKAGRDSARVSAWLVDVVTRHRAEPIELRDATERMDRIADSLTLVLLRDIGTVRPVSQVGRASMGSASLPAIRAFLKGEQHLRRTEWDSARAEYSRALALDSTFALAHSHIGLTYGWQRFGMDSLARMHALHAGALNVGLGPRDSLLIVADSLRSVTYAYAGDPQYRAHVVRLFATLRRATDRYEQDAESWYRLADAYFHFGIGPGLSVPEAEILRTFDRSISLDSAFAIAYIHPVELGFSIGDSARALHYARRYFALLPGDVSAAGTLLAARLLSGASDDMRDARQTIDTASADLLFQAYSAARRSLDPHAVALELLRAMTHARRVVYPPLADPAFARHRLALELSFRGRFAEALTLREARQSGVLAEMALASPSMEPDARAVFAGWLRTDPREPTFGFPLLAASGGWWAQRRDTASLREMVRRMGGAILDGGADSLSKAYSTAVAGAYLALARADTVESMRRFAALPDSLCELCAVPRLIYARVLAASGRLREAASLLADRPTLLPSAIDVLWALERARVAERLGDRAMARARYAMVAAAWRDADADLAPVVAEARAALQRLAH
ncbi:MAG: protein kinase domain-containing protein [Gemmatimonadaceae bacterium]